MKFFTVPVFTQNVCFQISFEGNNYLNILYCRARPGRKAVTRHGAGGPWGHTVGLFQIAAILWKYLPP